MIHTNEYVKFNSLLQLLLTFIALLGVSDVWMHFKAPILNTAYPHTKIIHKLEKGGGTLRFYFCTGNPFGIIVLYLLYIARLYCNCQCLQHGKLMGSGENYDTNKWFWLLFKCNLHPSIRLWTADPNLLINVKKWKIKSSLQADSWLTEWLCTFF